MPKKPRRGYKMISFKAYYDSDADILDWWEGCTEGERSEALRDLIRERLGLGMRPAKRLSIPELSVLQHDTAWIRQALSDMPAWLESYLHELAARPTVQTIPNAVAPAGAGGMADNESQRRSKRIQDRGW